MGAALRRELHFESELPSIRETVANFKLWDHKLQGSLRREPRFEKEPPSILETVAHSQDECPRRESESYTLTKNRHPSLKLLHMFKTNVRGAKARATF